MAKEPRPSKSMKIRSRIVMTAIFLAGFSAVAGNFFKISVLQNKKYQNMANDQHFGSITISADRGTIYDAKGAVLAKSATVYKMILDPQRFQEDMEALDERIKKRTSDIASGKYQPATEKTTDENGNEQVVIKDIPLPESSRAFRKDAVALITEKLGIEEDFVEDSMEQDNRYVVLQDQVDKAVADEVMAFFTQYDLTCLNMEEDTKRYYPQNELASQVIGFTNADGDGVYGVEAYYDDYLSGIDGRVISATDSHGNALPYRYAKTYDAKDGDDIYLTIDMNIQYCLEKHLKEMNENYDVKNRSCAILMNAKSGAVYGMATYPNFDLNDPYTVADPLALARLEGLEGDELAAERAEEREKQWKNKCITEVYEPGSVFKVVTSASAIEENLIDLERDNFHCDGSVTLEGALQPINCHDTSGHGDQTFQEALTHSCNPAFMEIGRRLGVEKFCYYFDAFGLRERTGIDLPAESAGVEYTADEMTNVDLALSAMGQAETITPIEMITSYCATINGGYLLQPYVVDKVVDEDGNIVLKNDRTVRRQVISEDTSATMRKCLEQVVTSNNGGNVTIKGYSIGGKSGTSQRLSITAKGTTAEENGAENADTQEYGASYCCFTPADDPEIILLVLADMPDKQKGYYGSQVAVPTAREILTEVLPYMGISPVYTEEELANLDVKIPMLQGSVSDAIQTLTDLGVNAEKVGEGNTVVAQSPVTGSTIAKGGTVYLYTESSHTVDYTEVPSFVGLSPQQVNEAVVWKHLNYVGRGASTSREDCYVSSQSIEAGTKVAVGTTIELEFMVYGDSD